MAGFASILAVIWFIIGYYQQGKEQKEQRALIEKQIDLEETRNFPRIILQRLSNPEINNDKITFNYSLSVFGEQINISNIVKGDSSLLISGINKNTILYPNAPIDISIQMPKDLDMNLRKIRLEYFSLSNIKYEKIFNVC